MGDDRDHAGLDEVTAERDHALRALEHLLPLLQQLRVLVGHAFEEGFRAAHPDPEEPWLVDWLQSRSKRQLDRLMARPGREDDGDEGLA